MRCRLRFTGTIDKLNYKLGPSQLSAEDQKKMEDASQGQQLGSGDRALATHCYKRLPTN